jgi:hypothetical protein
MVVTRREFNKYAGKGILLGAVTVSLAMEGCSVAQDILDWEPFALLAFNNLVTMLETFGVLTADPALVLIVGAVRIGLNDLYQDAKLYLAIKPPPQGALQEIQAVLTLVAGNIKALFATIHTAFGSIVDLIIGLVQLILGAISGFLNRIGSKIGSVAGAKGITLADSFKFTASGQTVSYLPLDISLGQFRSRWNKICASQGHFEMYI